MSSLLEQRVLVTGANGLLGQQLVRQLSDMPDYDVLATARENTLRDPEVSCGYTPLDITEPADVRRVFLDFAPGVVVNCAAMTEVDRCEDEREACWRVNVDAVEHLAKACKSLGSRLVHVSTDFVFDGAGGPYAEEDRPHPVNFYGRSKLASENVVRQLGLQRWSIIRTVLVYGTGVALGRPNIALWVLDRLSAGHAIQVVTDQIRSPTYAPDLAAGIERIIRRRRDGVYHLSGREILSVYDFARRLAEAFGLDASLIGRTDQSRFRQRAQRPLRTGFVILKAETELGYKPRTLHQAFEHLASRWRVATPS